MNFTFPKRREFHDSRCVVCNAEVLNPLAENAAYVVFGKVCCSEAHADVYRQAQLGEQQRFPTYIDYASI